LDDTLNKNQVEKDKKELLEKIKNIRSTLINDLIERKKFISLLSEKIDEEKDIFFKLEEHNNNNNFKNINKRY
jgi:hypothetical protein